jgi:hypothetical protein
MRIEVWDRNVEMGKLFQKTETFHREFQEELV